jgi:menaquinol-cytochrome c reductase iron-sulfur subunit
VVAPRPRGASPPSVLPSASTTDRPALTDEVDSVWKTLTEFRVMCSGTASGPGSTKGSLADLLTPRRQFLAMVSTALSGVAGLLVGVPVVGFLFAPLARRPDDVWRPVGPVVDFPTGQTVRTTYMDPQPLPWAGFSARSAAYVRRLDASTAVAFSLYCTHTGCPVQWVPAAKLFLCPCHGGAFHDDGSVAAGPPPRALDRHEARVRNGMVEVRTRRMPLAPRGV